MSTSQKPLKPRAEHIADIDRQHQDLSTATIAFHEVVARRLGMTAAERKCLGVLGKLRTCTPGQLAEATGLTTGAITGIVDRLEGAGYLQRRVHPKDRRSVLLQPLRSDRLQRLTQPVFRSLGAAMAELANEYSDRELGVILQYLTRTTAILRHEIGIVQTEPPARRLTLNHSSPSSGTDSSSAINEARTDAGQKPRERRRKAHE